MALPLTVRRAFEKALDPHDVLTDPVQCRAYECDGLTGYRVVPELVLLPATRRRSPRPSGSAREHRVPFVARGAGTGLSGGALPVADGVVISLARLKRILEVDPVDRRAVVEPGVTNLEITAAAAPHGLYYAPDPSQPAGLHDRRQRRGELRRRALPQVRVHHEPRAGDGGRAGRRVGRHPRHRDRRRRPGRTCAGCSSARRARWGSPRRSPSGCCARPSRCARCWPTSRRSPRRATSSATSSPRGSCPPPWR